MTDEHWEKELRKKLLDVLKTSFKDNHSLSDELKGYAIKNHLLEDITNFIQNEHRLFDQNISLCGEKELQEKINEIVNRNNYFYVGWLNRISYDLWQVEPSNETSSKWQIYMLKHKEQGAKVQTFYAHVEENCDEKMRSMVESNKDNTFCLNDSEKKRCASGGTKAGGIIYILEYSKISYNVFIAGDCLLNGIKARQLHDIHKSEVVVYPRATTSELFKNYTKSLLRTNADALILHFGTYDLTLGGQSETVENIRKFIKKVKEKRPHLTIAISSIIVRVDKKGMRSSVKTINSQLKSLCDEEQVAYINNDNITESLLCQKMLLTLTQEGKNTLAKNISTYIDNLL